MHQEAIEYAQYKAQRVKDILPNLNSKNINVLDFGCADGLMTYYLQEVFFEATVVGADQSKKAIEYADQQYPEMVFKLIENKKLPFADNYFDAIVAADVLHHIPFENHTYWIQELKRVLKPQGYLILLEQNPWNWAAYKQFNNNPEEKNATMLSPWYAKKLLQKFSTIHWYFYNFFPNYLSCFVFLEPILTKIPCGRFYILVAQK